MKKKFLIGGIIICLAIGYLAFLGFQRSATYYYSVSELATVKADQGNSTEIKVNGQVLAGSVRQETARSLRFTLAEGGQSLPVVYQGAVPDTFQDGIEVVVQGRLDSAGIFRANSILTKCPTKYEPQ